MLRNMALIHLFRLPLRINAFSVVLSLAELGQRREPFNKTVFFHSAVVGLKKMQTLLLLVGGVPV